MKNEIRGSAKYLVAGIDVAKERHHAFFGRSDGRTLMRRLVFGNTGDGFEKLLFHAEAIKKQHALETIVFGMEPTADYHKPLAEYLIRRGYPTVLVAGAAVKKNRELLDGRWDKHDTKDAANIADLVSQGKCLFCEFPSSDLRELRGLLSFKRRLTKQQKGYRVRIRNHLIAQYFQEMDPYFSYGEGPAIIARHLDPAALSNIPCEAFIPMVSSRNGGERQRRRLFEIHAKAGASIGCAVTSGVSFEAAMLIEAMGTLHGMLEETDRKIAEACKRFPEYPCLLSIPGFGPDISAKVLGGHRQSPPV